MTRLLSEASPREQRVVQLFGFSLLFPCQRRSYGCYLLNVKGLIVCTDGAASTDASACAGLFFQTVWCLNTPGATPLSSASFSTTSGRLGSFWHPHGRSQICSLLSEYWPPPPPPSWYSNAVPLAGREADAGTGAAACQAGISARLSAPQ